MLEKESFLIGEEDGGMRLDKYLTRQVPRLTRSYVQNLINDGKVWVDGIIPAKTGLRLKPGQVIKLVIPALKELEVAGEDIFLDVIYEDGDVIVVNKPQGMVVHPAKGHDAGTLVNALLYHCKDLSGINGILRPGIVHRLDKDTSGLIMAAKNDMAHLHLASQLKRRLVKREYEAIVYGNPVSKSGTIDAPLGRHPRERKKIAVTQGGRKAVTHYYVLEEFQGFCHLRLQLETGRTHQIRVHLSSIGHPVLGDPVYGRRKERFLLSGQALHAAYLRFEHPRKGVPLEFRVQAPAEFQAVLAALKEEAWRG